MHSEWICSRLNNHLAVITLYHLPINTYSKADGVSSKYEKILPFAIVCYGIATQDTQQQQKYIGLAQLIFPRIFSHLFSLVILSFSWIYGANCSHLNWFLWRWNWKHWRLWKWQICMGRKLCLLRFVRRVPRTRSYWTERDRKREKKNYWRSSAHRKKNQLWETQLAASNFLHSTIQPMMTGWETWVGRRHYSECREKMLYAIIIK